MEAVILTKSDMYGDSCVTAYDPAMNRFFRFVSHPDGSPIDKRISDGFNLLDVVSVDVLRDCPRSPQTENLLVNQYSFSVIGQYESGIIGEIYHRIQKPSPFQSFALHPGWRLRSVSQYDHSLELIPVSNLRIFVNESDRVKADFYYEFEKRYKFSVTDPKFKADVRRSNTKELRFKRAYIMVSISLRPHEKDGYYYKFIAAIYPVQAFPF